MPLKLSRTSGRVDLPHEPKPPFIRLISEDGDARVIRPYCSICRKQVRIEFFAHGEEGEEWRNAVWSHVESSPPPQD